MIFPAKLPSFVGIRGARRSSSNSIVMTSTVTKKDRVSRANCITLGGVENMTEVTAIGATILIQTAGSDDA